ncbi:hypothetical protein [Aeromicrobium sp. CTD01-1L150]|uniref:hypothetical protein n=1 Tax=Aeromicrobium sp. CTD01-1L150 TaxID=3341830 RepID=UPI0035C00810
MSVHAFVDETKVGHLMVVATVVSPGDLQLCRRALKDLRMKGQRRIHFTKESDPRRRKIIDAMCELPVVVDIYVADSARDRHDARPAALRRLTLDLLEARAQWLVIEQDDSVVDADRRVIFEALGTHRAELQYAHARPGSEPLLWVSDAVGWCRQRGAPWKERADRIVRASHQV